MNDKKQEQVLCFKRELLRELGEFQGINGDVGKYFPAVTDPANTVYIGRDEAEHNEAYLQLIPYILVFCPKHGDRILRYRRGKSGGENRLHDLYSIGLGGHISRTDTEDPALGVGYQQGLAREMLEEIGMTFVPDQSPAPAAVLYDDTTSVGRVHFGVVHVVLADNEGIISRCADIEEPEFVGVFGAVKHVGMYEGWSQFCLQNWITLASVAHIPMSWT